MFYNRVIKAQLGDSHHIFHAGNMVETRFYLLDVFERYFVAVAAGSRQVLQDMQSSQSKSEIEFELRREPLLYNIIAAL